MIKISLSQNQITYIDNIDSDLNNYTWSAFKGQTNNTYYALRHLGIWPNRKTLYIHIIIMERMLGRSLVKGELVDHKDGNGLNNLRNNLRLVSNSLNQANRKIDKDNTSGYKGVSLFKRDSLWRSRIKVNNKDIHLAYFTYTEQGKIEAAKMYDRAALYFFGEFASLNFPELKNEYLFDIENIQYKWMK